jgi:MOSC domain-containing protein YiiM
MGMIVSVNVGLPQDVAWQGGTVRTGVWKTPVTGRIFARRLNLDGDGQGDLRGHGGEQRAIMVYQLDSYRYWAKYNISSGRISWSGISARGSAAQSSRSAGGRS